MSSASSDSRYALVESSPHRHLESFAEAVESGLCGLPKSLPCRFLYDEAGSRLFEEICELPEYYLTRVEREILEKSADEVAASIPEPIALAELGSGSSVKTRLLIEALLRRQERLRYVPVDISRTMLDETARVLLDDYAGLEIHAIAGEYAEGLHHVARENDRPKLIAWLGSNVGNFAHEEAARFLALIRAAMHPRDRVLLGADLRKSGRVLEEAYDDGAGVTARFNKNLLARINRELGGRFDLDSFAHRATWLEAQGRVKLDLVSRRAQEVAIDALGLTVKFEPGEPIHTEDSFKYAPAELDALAGEAGLRTERRWLDGRGWFSLSLLAPDA
jgi:L-histidine Nalpha-methyltransferase